MQRWFACGVGHDRPRTRKDSPRAASSAVLQHGARVPVAPERSPGRSGWRGTGRPRSLATPVRRAGATTPGRAATAGRGAAGRDRGGVDARMLRPLANRADAAFCRTEQVAAAEDGSPQGATGQDWTASVCITDRAARGRARRSRPPEWTWRRGPVSWHLAPVQPSGAPPRRAASGTPIDVTTEGRQYRVGGPEGCWPHPLSTAAHPPLALAQRRSTSGAPLRSGSFPHHLKCTYSPTPSKHSERGQPLRRALRARSAPTCAAATAGGSPAAAPPRRCCRPSRPGPG